MPNGWTPSDEIIKTNIKTIENALDKILLLRGVETRVGGELPRLMTQSVLK